YRVRPAANPDCAPECDSPDASEIWQLRLRPDHRATSLEIAWRTSYEFATANSLSSLAATFFEPNRLANAGAKKVQLRSADFAAADHFNLLDLRRVKWELALHAFIGHN